MSIRLKDTITGNLSGNSSTATTLATARTINGTSFNGSANITTANWGTARNIQIGNAVKSVNGSGNVTWSLSEIGAAAASHTHSYLPLSGGTLTGNVTISADSKLEWNRNTDYARISFKNTGDSDSDSYMHFLTGDNGNEYFKFSSLSGSTTTDLLTIKTDHLRYKGNAVYHAGNKPTASDIGAAASSHTHNYAGSSSAGGNANAAVKLATARTLAVTGAVTGSASFDGSANASISTSFKVPTSGAWWNGGAVISATDGVSEVGKYLDFHNTSASTNDYDLRLQVTAANKNVVSLPTASGTLALTSDNVATATQLQNARTINGTSFNGTANITTANWGTARTLTIGATGKSVNGSGNVAWTWAEMQVPRAYSASYGFGGNQNAITTAQFITLLTNAGAFSQPYWISRGSWSYANNQYINDTGCGNIHLAGCVVEVIGTSTAYTIRVTTPTTTSSGTTNAEFIYVNNGADYSPGWRRQYNTKNKPTPAEIGAASTAVATTSANGLMSKADKSKLDSIATNAQFKMTVTSSSWTADGSLYSTTINHNLNKEVLYVSAYDSSSKKSIFVSYTIINNNSLKVTVESAINAVITIVVEGGLINLAAGGISDSTTAANTTWSSTKIQSAISAAVKDGTTSQKGIVQLSSATNSTSTTLAATASAVKAAYDLANTANNTANTIKNSTNNNRTITMSTADPSGGKHGDIWFKYE